MKRMFTFVSTVLCSLSLIMTGCESDSDDGGDIGDNNPDLVACVGDSIMAGVNCAGAPFPVRLAAKSGKTVLNYAKPGAKSNYGPSVINSVLAKKPGYVCIMIGSNDASAGHSPEAVKANIAAMIVACQSHHSKPIVATPPQMAYGHAIYNGNCKAVSEAIRQATSELGAKLVDINSACGSNPEKYLNPADGLHLSEEGGELLANKFNGAL